MQVLKPLLLLQDFYGRRSEWEQLVSVLEELIAEAGTKHPENKVNLLLVLAQIFDKRLGKQQEALDLYRKAVTIDPGCIEGQKEREGWIALEP